MLNEGLVEKSTFAALMDHLVKYTALGDMSVDDIAEVILLLLKTLDEGGEITHPAIGKITIGVSARVTPPNTNVTSSFRNLLNLPSKE